jgi:cystathionine beta-lyase/cystathionine gamma-synthase
MIGALATSSGMAAIAATALALLNPWERRHFLAKVGDRTSD